jgi:hypothetical protein
MLSFMARSLSRDARGPMFDSSLITDHSMPGGIRTCQSVTC